MSSLAELERRHAEAHRAWQQHPAQETERALERAADALRWARQGQYEAEGVTRQSGVTLADDDDADDDEGS